jgi:hypothetical protein
MYFAPHLIIHFGNFHHDRKRNGTCNLRHTFSFNYWNLPADTFTDNTMEMR